MDRDDQPESAPSISSSSSTRPFRQSLLPLRSKPLDAISSIVRVLPSRPSVTSAPVSGPDKDSFLPPFQYFHNPSCPATRTIAPTESEEFSIMKSSLKFSFSFVENPSHEKDLIPVFSPQSPDCVAPISSVL